MPKNKIVVDTQHTIINQKNLFGKDQEKIEGLNLKFAELNEEENYALYEEGCVVKNRFYKGYTYYTINRPLLEILKNADAAGYNITISTGDISEDKTYLLRLLLGSEIHTLPRQLAFICNKSDVERRCERGEQVYALIDDMPDESFLETLKKSNPALRHFHPDNLSDIAQYLGVSTERQAGRVIG